MAPTERTFARLWSVARAMAACGAAVAAAACAARQPQREPAPRARLADPSPYVPATTSSTPVSGVTLGVAPTQGAQGPAEACISFVQGLLDEDVEAVMALFSNDFMLIAAGGPIPRDQLRNAWQRQFAMLDYQQFTVDEVLRREDIEVLAFEDQDASILQALPGLRPGDVLVRFRSLLTGPDATRYFADMTLLWLRQEEGRWLIVAMEN